jgi:hypothetical protein
LIELNDEENQLCDILTGEPLHIGKLSRELSRSSSEVLASALALDLKDS